VSVVNRSNQIKEEIKNLLKQVTVCATELGEAEKIMWTKFDELSGKSEEPEGG